MIHRISGGHFKEAEDTKTGLKAPRFVKGKKEEEIALFLLGDVHWEESSFQVSFLGGPTYCYLVSSMPSLPWPPLGLFAHNSEPV